MTNGIPLDFFLVCFLFQSSENVTYFFLNQVTWLTFCLEPWFHIHKMFFKISLIRPNNDVSIISKSTHTLQFLYREVQVMQIGLADFKQFFLKRLKNSSELELPLGSLHKNLGKNDGLLLNKGVDTQIAQTCKPTKIRYIYIYINI